MLERNVESLNSVQDYGDAGARFVFDVGLVGQPWLAEVDLLVDHAGQQPASLRVEYALVCLDVQPHLDVLDATLAHKQAEVEAATFIGWVQRS